MPGKFFQEIFRDGIGLLRQTCRPWYFYGVPSFMLIGGRETTTASISWLARCIYRVAKSTSFASAVILKSLGDGLVSLETDL